MALQKYPVAANRFNCSFNSLAVYFLDCMTQSDHKKNVEEYLEKTVFPKLKGLGDFDFLEKESLDSLLSIVVDSGNGFAVKDKYLLLGWVLKAYHITTQQEKTLDEAFGPLKRFKEVYVIKCLESKLEGLGRGRKVNELSPDEMAEVQDLIKAIEESYNTLDKGDLKSALREYIADNSFILEMNKKIVFSDDVYEHHNSQYDSFDMTSAKSILHYQLNKMIADLLADEKNVALSKLEHVRSQYKDAEGFEAAILEFLGEAGAGEIATFLKEDNVAEYCKKLNNLIKKIKTLTEDVAGDFNRGNIETYQVEFDNIDENLTTEKVVGLMKEKLLKFTESPLNAVGIDELITEAIAFDMEYIFQTLIDANPEDKKPLPRFFYNNNKDRISAAEVPHFEPWINDESALRQDGAQCFPNQFDDFYGFSSFVRRICICTPKNTETTELDIKTKYQYFNQYDEIIDKVIALKRKSKLLHSQKEEGAAKVMQDAYDDATSALACMVAADVSNNPKGFKAAGAELRSKFLNHLKNNAIRKHRGWKQVIFDVLMSILIIPVIIRKIEDKIFGVNRLNSMFALSTKSSSQLEELNASMMEVVNSPIGA